MGRLLDLWVERKGWCRGGSRRLISALCLQKAVTVGSEQKAKADSSKVNGNTSRDYATFHKNFTAFHKDFTSMAYIHGY